MLNLRTISLTSSAQGSKGSSLLLTDLRFRAASCTVVANLGAPLTSGTQRDMGEEEEDDDERLDAGKGDDRDDQDREEMHQVSDDPLVTGIVDEME